MDEAAYIPGLGFRAPGWRLLEPVTVERPDRTLTVRHFLTTPEGAELAYEFSGELGGIAGPGEERSWIGSSYERIVLRSSGHEYDLSASGRPRTSVTAQRAVRKWSLAPLPVSEHKVEIALESPIVGQWDVPLELGSFGHDPEVRSPRLDATATRNGLTIAVHYVAVTSTETAVELGLVHQERGTRGVGLGGLHGNREGPSALMLRDARGREWRERARIDHAMRDHSGRSDLALFDPLPADARDLILVVPFVYVMEGGEVEIDLPVSAPIDTHLAAHPLRILGSSIGTPRSAPPQYGPALQIALDLAGWDDNERVLMPCGIKVDGQGRGMGTGGINTTDPQPVATIEALGQEVVSARKLTLTGAWVQVRGPWEVPFRR